jgi:hypothetical protein
MQFESLGQIKFSVGADRANVRFVDINGDASTILLFPYSILTPNRVEPTIFGSTSSRARTKFGRTKALETQPTMGAAIFIGMPGVFRVVVEI